MKNKLYSVVILSFILGGGLLTSQAAGEEILRPFSDNDIFYNNYENLFDSNGELKPSGAPLEVGDHLVGLFQVQNIEVGGVSIFFAGFDNQLTGIFAQRIEAIFDPDPFGTQTAEPHVVLGTPTRTDFCSGSDCFSTGLNGGEVLAFYRDAGPGATLFTYGGPMANDVANAIDGDVWLTLGIDPTLVRDDPGYFYSHTDGNFPPPDKAFAGLNAIVNNTGFPFFGINDVNENEIGGDILTGDTILFNDLILTSELELNPSSQAPIPSPWLVRSNDPATLRPFELVEGACRFTGGGVDTVPVDTGALVVEVPVWDGNFESGVMMTNGEENRYTFGGQAGANTGAQPQPKGEWTHHQQNGPAGSFVFHGGTASAPEGTEIDAIRCSDPGSCSPARPAPTKQLDFDGIGTFRNVGKGKNKPDFLITAANVKPEGRGNRTFSGSFHWFEVNVDDLGEPGNENSGQNLDPLGNPNICPPDGFGEKSETELADCRCPDYYRITIYDGVNASDVVKNPDGSIDPASLNRTDVIYEVYGYINGGNLQIHPPTGFDLN